MSSSHNRREFLMIEFFLHSLACGQMAGRVAPLSMYRTEIKGSLLGKLQNRVIIPHDDDYIFHICIELRLIWFN